MKKLLTILSILLLTSCSSVWYQANFTPAFKNPYKLPVRHDKVLVFSDDFDDIYKTQSNGWTFGEVWSGDQPTIKDGNAPYIIWLKDQVQFDFANSQAILTTENNPNTIGQPSVKSGELTTWKCWNQLYGYFEVRMKVPSAGVKYWPAFLLYNAASGWLPEVDIAEFDQSNNTGFSSTIHPVDQTIKCPHTFYNFHTDLSSQFHTYALEWTKDYIKIYLDNILIFTETSWVPQVPLYVLIGNGVSQGASSVDVPGILYIDYLRIYK